jgi:hypothetical protein
MVVGDLDSHQGEACLWLCQSRMAMMMKRLLFILVLLSGLLLIVQWFIIFTREPVVRCDGGEPWRGDYAGSRNKRRSK